MPGMRSTVVACLAGSLAAWPPAAAAQGSPPTEVSGTIVIPANTIKAGACALDVSWTFNGKAGQIVLPDGRFIFTAPGLIGSCP